MIRLYKPVITDGNRKLPYVYLGRAPAQANNHTGENMDITRALNYNEETGFLADVIGESITTAEISDGDTLVVETNCVAEHGDVVITLVDNDFTLRKFVIENGVSYLVTENSTCKKVPVKTEGDFSVFGVVVAIMKTRRKR